MYRCESWTIKKAERQRIDAFELWCWRVLRGLLRVPCSAKRSNQSILKEISPEYSLEGLILKLKLRNFGHLMQRTDTFEKMLMLGKIDGRRRRGRQRMRRLDDITYQLKRHHHSNQRVWANSGSWWWTVGDGMLQSMGSQRVRHDWATELNWTECSWSSAAGRVAHVSSGLHGEAWPPGLTRAWNSRRRDYIYNVACTECGWHLFIPSSSEAKGGMMSALVHG